MGDVQVMPKAVIFEYKMLNTTSNASGKRSASSISSGSLLVVSK